MGFSLELFFRELNDLLSKEQKAAKTLKEIKRLVYEQEKYARDCGQIPKTNMEER